MPDTPFSWTDLSLTLGRWGQPPLGDDDRRQVLRTLANWAKKTKQPLRVELYAGTDNDRALIEEFGGELAIVVRMEPRSDRFDAVASLFNRQSNKTPLDKPTGASASEKPGLKPGAPTAGRGPWASASEKPGLKPGAPTAGRGSGASASEKPGLKPGAPTEGRGPGASASEKPGLEPGAPRQGASGEVVLDVPVSREAAAVRFLPKGIERTPEFAARAARDAALAGLTPEIALVDIARADREDVAAVVEAVLDALQVRRAAPRWRLVDSTGSADPLAGATLPRAFARWLPWLEYEFEIEPSAVTVQAADTLGLAVANSLAGRRVGAGVAAPLFGAGIGAGWAAAEVLIAHELGDTSRLKKLHGLRELLAGETRDPHRPVSGGRAWQFAGGASPEKPREELLQSAFPVDPEALAGLDPEPLLTALSGHAGLLHLMHRRWPELHFETDDERALAISASFEAEFAAGRQQPVSWTELYPKVIESGIVDDARKEA